MSIPAIIIFWTLIVLAAFAFALAVQMRVMIGILLRKALMARDAALDAGQANAAISWAAGQADLPDEAEPWLNEQVDVLRADYAKPLSHLRIARRWCLIAPVLVLLLVALGRFRLGVL